MFVRSERRSNCKRQCLGRFLDNRAPFLRGSFYDIGHGNLVDEGIRCFVKIAKESLLKKPIIVLKSGISQAGKRAVSSHTGFMADSEKAYDATFERTSLTKVQTIEEYDSHGKDC